MPETMVTTELVGKWSEFASKVLFVLVGSCYSVGLIIVNLHLTSLGIGGAELLRSDFVLAGASFLVMLGAFLLLGPAIAYGVSVSRANWSRRSRWSAIGITALYLMTPIAFPVIVISAFADSRVKFNRWSDWFLILLLAAMAFQARLLATTVRGYVEKRRTPFDLPEHRYFLHYHALGVAGLFILFLGAVVAYARSVYPYLSAAYGGGARSPVLLVLAPDEAQLAPFTSLPFDENTRTLGPVELVFESERDFFVALPLGTQVGSSRKAVRIRRDLVAAIAPAAKAQEQK